MSTTTLLAKDIRAQAERQVPSKYSRLRRISRTFLCVMAAFMFTVSIATPFKAQAGIAEAGKQVVSEIVNFCNPNSVKVNMLSPDSAAKGPMGAFYNPVAEGALTLSADGGRVFNEYATFLRTGGKHPDSGMQGGEPGSRIKFVQEPGSTRPIFGFEGVRSTYEKDAQVGVIDTEAIAGTGYAPTSGAGLRPAGSVYEGARANSATVALRELYSPPAEGTEARKTWEAIRTPQYARYGFGTLTWDSFGAPCGPHLGAPMMSALLYLLVHLPTEFAFAIIKLALSPSVAGIFWSFSYPITAVMGKVFTPLLATIAIFFGLPYVYAKNRGSVAKVLSSMMWIGAMMMMITQLSSREGAKEFTEMAQGSVILLSGSISCTIANSTYTQENGFSLSGNPDNEEAKDQGLKVDAENAQDFKEKAKSRLQGSDNDTACGTYMDGIYQALWSSVPLQTWAEGQVGAEQAALDRASQGAGHVGWYQAILNSKYIRTGSAEAEATIRGISLWNGGGYSANGASKINLWDQPGVKPSARELRAIQLATGSKATGTEAHSGLEDWGWGPVDGDFADSPVGESRDTSYSGDFAIWRYVPQLQIVKLMCKDDNFGSNRQEFSLPGSQYWMPAWAEAIAYDSDNPLSDYRNKWLFEGNCTQGYDAGMIRAFQGVNIPEKAINVLVGHALSGMIFWMAVAVGGYILVQRFIWGWMLMFAPVILGIASIPIERTRKFAAKYGEFVVSNIVKQVAAVLTLVVTATALKYIIYPAWGESITGGAYVPSFLKIFLAAFFLMSAIFFVIPLRKIFKAAFKGNADVVTDLSKAPGKAVKTTAKVAAAGALVAGTAFVGAAALKGGTAASGLTGTVARGLKSGSIAKVARAGAAASYISGFGKTGAALAGLSGAATAGGELMGATDALMKANPLADRGDIVRGTAKNMLLNKNEAIEGAPISLEEAKAAEQYAMRLNNAAAKQGGVMPYEAKNGELTERGLKKAVIDMRRAQSGVVNDISSSSGHYLSPQAVDRQKKMIAQSLMAENPELKQEEALRLAESQLMAQNDQRFNMQDQLTSGLLAEDAKLPPEQRQYLNSNGELTDNGRAKLLADSRSLEHGIVSQATHVAAANMLIDGSHGIDKILNEQGVDAAMQVANVKASELILGENPAFAEAYLNTSGNTQVPLAMSATGAWVPTTAKTSLEGVNDPQAVVSALDNSRQSMASSPAVVNAIDSYARVAVNSGGQATPEMKQAYLDVLSSGYRDIHSNIDQNAAPITDVAQSIMDVNHTTPFTDADFSAVNQVALSNPISSQLTLEQMRKYNGMLESGEVPTQAQREAMRNSLTQARDMDVQRAYSEFASNVPTPYVDHTPEHYADLVTGNNMRSVEQVSSLTGYGSYQTVKDSSTSDLGEVFNFYKERMAKDGEETEVIRDAPPEQIEGTPEFSENEAPTEAMDAKGKLARLEEYARQVEEELNSDSLSPEERAKREQTYRNVLSTIRAIRERQE